MPSACPAESPMMTFMDTSRLCAVMDDLARRTWKDVIQAREWGLHRGEVTITETLLLALKVYERQAGLGFALSIVPTSQATERRSGADFEIWLQIGPHSYFAYSIQAKKAALSKTKGSHEKGSYNTLGHEGHPSPAAVPNARKGAPFQYDTLIAHAAQNQTIPIHLFYNGWQTAPAGVFLGSNPPADELYGCAVIPTPKVKAIREAKPRSNNQISAYAPDLQPWSTLFRQPAPGSGSGTGPFGGGPGSGPSVGRPRSWPPGRSLRSEPSDRSTSHELGAPIDTRNRSDLAGLGASFGRDGGYPERLPAYLTHAIEVSEEGRGELPDDPTLPRFAMLLRDPR